VAAKPVTSTTANAVAFVFLRLMISLIFG